MNDFFVYIIQSSSGKNYIGQTNNLTDRLNRHNSDRSTYTKNKGHWELVVAVNLDSRSEAVLLEMKLKKMKNSKKAIAYLQKMILSNNIYRN